jgi:catechol 2,3-dioxygenase-like lactoylglutathione lyase family enzyme
MKYKTIDHIVITTENLEACLHFYVDILGMRAEEKNGRYALFFGNQKFNIHTRKAEFLPAAGNPEYGSVLPLKAASKMPKRKSRKKAAPSKKALSHAMGRGVK